MFIELFQVLERIIQTDDAASQLLIIKIIEKIVEFGPEYFMEETEQ
jgi:hypothetical protein